MTVSNNLLVITRADRSGVGVKSDKYRAKATECAELSANTRDPASKRIRGNSAALGRACRWSRKV
jgi:hypothetical protein